MASLIAGVSAVSLPERLVICDLDESFCEAARRSFVGHSNVEIRCERLEEVRGVDCAIWPGNSQGLPTSGLDRALSHFLGIDVLDQVRAWITSTFGEEGCPIGSALLVDMSVDNASVGHPRSVAYVAVFPRCRDGPELAMLGAMRAIAEHNALAVDAAADREPSKVKGGGHKYGRPLDQIRSIVCPGLGTFTGCPHAEEAAEQMVTAWQTLECSVASRVSGAACSSRDP